MPVYYRRSDSMGLECAMYIRIILAILLFVSELAQGDEVVWDIIFDNEFNLPLTTVNLVDQSVVMAVDTGSRAALHLPMDLIYRIPNKSEKSPRIKSMDLSGKINELRIFTVNNLKLNSLIFERVDVVEYKPWGLSFSRKNITVQDTYTGLNYPVIGLDLFAGYILTLDFPENKIVIADVDRNDIPSYIENQWIPLPFHVDNEGVIIEMSDGVKNYNMILDSGASASIIKQQSLLPQTRKITNYAEGYSVVALEINNIHGNQIDAIVLDSLPDCFRADGLVGIDFLKQNRVKIDFKNKKLWIRKVMPSER